jgi:putative DNA primase/helicase
MKTKATPLSWALRYAGLDWRVIPIYEVTNGRCACSLGKLCTRPGKHPRTQNGVKDATNDKKQISLWWRQWPDANIGIATGKASNIIVVDADPRHGGRETLEKLHKKLGPWTKTVSASTGGGGRHYIFPSPDFSIKSDTNGKLLGPGLDVLSDGSYFIASNSRHVSGHRYSWRAGRSPDEIEPAKLPKLWLERLHSRGTEKVPETGLVTPTAVLEGGRNAHLTSLAGTLRRANTSREAMFAALSAENKARCSPPLDHAEIKKIVSSISKYPADLDTNRSDDAEKMMTTVLNQHFAKGEHLIFGPDSQFWYYTGKLWIRVPDSWIHGRVLEAIQASPLRTSQHTSSLITQVRMLLEARLATSEDPLRFLAEPPSVINCANGEVRIADDGSIDFDRHRPDSHLRNVLDVSYDPEAKCPTYDDALLGIFAKADDPKALRRHWNELAGYIVQPRRNNPLIVILLGGGDNGKTVLARTLVRLIGQEQVQAQRVEELEKNRFAIGSLLGKQLFLDDDVRAGARLPDGTLKKISEAKEVTGEAKYRPDFQFVVRTVPMLLCNNVPSLADVSHGMLRRLMIIPFDRRFTGEDKDSTLFDRIWANEMPGVLNRALKGYSRLVRRGHFDPPAAVYKATKRWVDQANPVPAFIQEACIRRPEAKCQMTELYPAFRQWAEQAGFTMVQNQLSFRRNLEHLGFSVGHNNQGQRVKGLKLR